MSQGSTKPRWETSFDLDMFSDSVKGNIVSWKNGTLEASIYYVHMQEPSGERDDRRSIKDLVRFQSSI
jgi:hypothetical protein